MNKFKYETKLNKSKLLVKKNIKIKNNKEKLFTIKNKQLELNILTKIEKRRKPNFSQKL